MTDMMADVIKRGTGRRALALNRTDIAGKTGTTNEAQRHLVQRLHADLVATVWVGFDQERPLGEAEEGARTALPIWIHSCAKRCRGARAAPRRCPTGS